MLWYITSSVAMGLASLFIYLYYMQKGQFKDSEDVKFQMFQEDDLE